MSDAQDKPAPRTRRRKLRIALLIVGFLLAALAAFVFIPAGGKSNSMQFLFQKVFTNEVGVAYAEFVVTNTGLRRVLSLGSHIHFAVPNADGSRFVAIDLPFSLVPKQSKVFNVRLPGRVGKCRLEWSWFEEPTRLQNLQFKLRNKANSILSGVGGDPAKWLNSLVQTNHSPEFTR